MTVPIARPARLEMLLDRLDKGGQLADSERQLLQELHQMITRLESAPKEFAVTAIVSRTTGQPRLDVVFGGHLAQLAPAAARSIAWSLIEAATFAESDAGLMRFIKERIGLEDTKATAMLNDIRAFRMEMQGSLVGHGDKTN